MWNETLLDCSLVWIIKLINWAPKCMHIYQQTDNRYESKIDYPNFEKLVSVHDLRGTDGQREKFINFFNVLCYVCLVAKLSVSGWSCHYTDTKIWPTLLTYLLTYFSISFILVTFNIQKFKLIITPSYSFIKTS